MKTKYYDTTNSSYFESNNTDFPEVEMKEDDKKYNKDSFQLDTEKYKNTKAKKIIIGHVAK